MEITQVTRLMKGLTAQPTARGIVVANLHYTADPVAFTPAILELEKARQGCVKLPNGKWKLSWKWRKEMEIDWQAQAGKAVFDPDWLDWQRDYISDPIASLNFKIGLDKKKRRRAKLTKAKDGKLGPVKLYLGPKSQPEGLPPDIMGVRRAFGIGVDVGEGVGASDSTIQVFTADTWDQAGEFASNTIKPSDLGRLATSLGRYYNDALICCVRPMHGLTTLRAIMDAGYPHVWRAKVHDRAVEYDAKNFGWNKGEASSPLLFGKWMDALEYHRVKLHSQTLLDQHRQYIYDESGRITHQKLAYLPVEVRNRHGDLVIASALALRACMDMPKFKKVTHEDPAPPGSMLYRTQQYRKRLRMERRDDRW